MSSFEPPCSRCKMTIRTCIFQFATSLRRRIIGGGILAESDLDELIAAREDMLHDSAAWRTTFMLIQVWGRAE
jgi:hypothetical protein